MNLSVLSSFGDLGQEKVSSEGTSPREYQGFLSKPHCGFGGFFLLSSPGEEMFLTFANYFLSCLTSACRRGEKRLGKKQSEKGA